MLTGPGGDACVWSPGHFVPCVTKMCVYVLKSGYFSGTSVITRGAESGAPVFIYGTWSGIPVVTHGVSQSLFAITP